LNLKRNQISKLPEDFNKLESLEEIELSENKFKNIPALLFNLQKLRKVFMNLNELQEFEIMDHDNNRILITNSQQFYIHYLFLVKNNINNLPEDLIKNPFFQKTIVHLALDDNPINRPNKDIYDIIKKEQLTEKVTFKLKKEHNQKEDKEENIETKTEDILVGQKNIESTSTLKSN